MNIKEYYEKYKVNKKYEPSFFGGKDKTIDDFYHNCISRHNLPFDNVVSWHKMFLEYIKRDDAIFWVRYHENGPKDEFTNRFKTRRACKTVFKNGFSYVYVSNYDAHEIFNMIRLGVTPDVDEFAEFMKDYEFPLHYDPGKSCEESDICCFPNIGSVKGGVLTGEHWYLAHIVGVKSDLYVDQTTNKSIDFDIERLYPRGEISDWQNYNGHAIRNLDYSLTLKEEQIVKAHFLRFVDPMNYYIVPSEKFQKNKIHRQIGSADCVNDYMRNLVSTLYLTEYNKFEEVALAPLKKQSSGSIPIDIEYDIKLKTSKSASTKNSKKARLKKHSGLSQSKNNDLEVAAYFMKNMFSLRKVEEDICGKENSHGAIAKSILDALGVTNDKKGLLIGSDIDLEISKATGIFKETLQGIKNKGL